MISLPYLSEEGYTEADVTSGFLRQMPLALQHTISVAMLEHLSSDASRVIKATVRSQEDLEYLMDTIGVSFGFSTSEYAASVRKAMDIYLLLFTPPLAQQLRIFEDPAVKEACLLRALGQLSLLVEVRHDFPAGTIPHLQLVARLMDHLSKILAAQESQLSTATWSAVLRMCLGMFDYVCSPQAGRLPSECRLTVGSVAMEALVRSKTRDAEIWSLYGARLPNTFAAAAQWAVVVVAITRAVASVATRRALPPCIPLAWRGVINPTRNVSNIISYSRDDIVFLWQKLSVLINPIRLRHVDALNVAAEAIRDSTMVLASAAYWPSAMAPGGCDDPNTELGVCSRKIPLGLSTDAILRVWGDGLLHLGMGSSAALMQIPFAELDDSRSRAIEGLCALLLRRESEVHCNHQYWLCFVKLMDDVCNGSSDRVRGHLLLNATALFLLDLPWPYGVVRKLCVFACEVLAELSDSTGGAAASLMDEDDDDGAAAKPKQPNEGDTDVGIEEASRDVVREAIEMQRAAICVAVNAAVIAHGHKDTPAVKGTLTALQLATQRFQAIPDVFQRALCGITHILRHIGSDCTSASDDAGEGRGYDVDELVETVVGTCMDMLTAPCGTYEPQTIVVALRFVAWNVACLPTAVSEDAALKIAVFCCAARRVIDNASTVVDLEALGSLFCVAAEVLCALLVSPRCILVLRSNRDVVDALARVVDAGFQAVRTHVQVLHVREASHRLLRAIEVGWWWPAEQGCSGTNSSVTELDLKDIVSSIQCFALGCSRVVTVAQLDHALVEARGATWAVDGDLVMIVRMRHGRRAWIVTKDVVGRPEVDVQELGSPKAMAAAASSFPSPMRLGAAPTTSSDMLREVDEQPRTAAMLDNWLSNSDITHLLELAALPPGSLDLADVNAPIAPSLSVADVLQQRSVLARHWIHDVGFPFATYKSLPLDRSIIAALKGLDRIPDRNIIDVDVLFVEDEAPLEAAPYGLASRTAFDALCAAIGWLPSQDKALRDAHDERSKDGLPNGEATRLFATPTEVLRFSACRKSFGAMSAAEDALAADHTGQHGQPKEKQFRPRVLWDSTSTRIDWTAMALRTHRVLYTAVCPSMRPSAHNTGTLDIIIRPLVQPGLYALALVWPDHVASEDASPAAWGGPLLHNTIVSAHALPGILRDVLISGVQRLYASPDEVVHPRSVALQSMLYNVAPLAPSQAMAAVLLPS